MTKMRTSRLGYIETKGHGSWRSGKFRRLGSTAVDRARHAPDRREKLGHLAVRQETHKARAWARFRPVITCDQGPRRRETEPPKLYQHRSVRAVNHVEVEGRKSLANPDGRHIGVWHNGLFCQVRGRDEVAEEAGLWRSGKICERINLGRGIVIRK